MEIINIDSINSLNNPGLLLIQYEDDKVSIHKSRNVLQYILNNMNEIKIYKLMLLDTSDDWNKLDFLCWKYTKDYEMRLKDSNSSYNRFNYQVRLRTRTIVRNTTGGPITTFKWVVEVYRGKTMFTVGVFNTEKESINFMNMNYPEGRIVDLVYSSGELTRKYLSGLYETSGKTRPDSVAYYKMNLVGIDE